MLINPITFRLSVSVFWKFTWSLYKYNNYKYLFYSDLIFFQYFLFFFRKLLKSKKSDYYLSHLRLYRIKKHIIINFYYYNPSEEVLYNQLKKNYLKKKKLKKVKWRKYIKKGKRKIRKYIRYWNKPKKIRFNRKYFFVRKNYLKKNKIKKKLIKKIIQKLKKTKQLKKFLKIKKQLQLSSKKKIKKLAIIKKTKNIQRNTNFNNNFFFFKKKKYKFNYFNIFDYFKKQKIFKVKGLGGEIFWAKKDEKGKIIMLNNWESRLHEIEEKNKKFQVQKYLWKVERKIKRKKKKFSKNYRKKYRLKFISLKKIKNKHLKKMLKLRNIFQKKKNITRVYKTNFYFLFKINFKKFLYNLKFLLYNIYIYILSKFLKKESKKILLNNFKNFKINFFKITLKQITAKLVGKYLKTTLKKNYSVWKGLRPVIADLNKRILLKQISGFKILFTGRFKRASRATYLWRKEGAFLIASPEVSIDYQIFLYKTKYGVCAIKIWITTGLKMFKYYMKIFPLFKIFFFINKKKYFLLLKNEFFFKIFLKKFYISYSTFNLKYFKNIIKNILYKYLYTNIFLKNLFLKKNKKSYFKLKRSWRNIFLPQYCLYKIYIENIIKLNYIKIKPFLDIKFLKRINIRSSYKLSFINKKSLKIKTFKYKILVK